MLFPCTFSTRRSENYDFQVVWNTTLDSSTHMSHVHNPLVCSIPIGWISFSLVPLVAGPSTTVPPLRPNKNWPIFLSSMNTSFSILQSKNHLQHNIRDFTGPKTGIDVFSFSFSFINCKAFEVIPEGHTFQVVVSCWENIDLFQSPFLWRKYISTTIVVRTWECNSINCAKAIRRRLAEEDNWVAWTMGGDPKPKETPLNST